MRNWKDCVVFAGLMAVVIVSARAQVVTGDAAQIRALFSAMADHSKTPAEVLDPQMSPAEREKNLQRLSAPHYELTLTPTATIPETAGDVVVVPVRTHFDDKNGNTLDAGTRATLVRRNGAWYFANFDFLNWPAFLITVLVLGVSVGVGYAATVLALLVRLRRKGMNQFDLRMFIPPYWPYMFRITRRASDGSSGADGVKARA